MKAAIYVRVSTDKQESNNQLMQLRPYAEKSKYEVFDEYVDVISGKEESRPAYDRMFKDAHKKLFDIILFWDLSRFSRAGTLFTLQKLKELENLGIDWESYQEPYLKSVGQFKDVVLSVISTVAKIEREKISERTKAGLERARKEGKTLGRPKISNYLKKQVIEKFKETGSINKSSKEVRVSYGKAHEIITAWKKLSEKGEQKNTVIQGKINAPQKSGD